MSKLTNTLIATALAIAVAGPAAAQPKILGAYVGDQLKVKINPQGCKNFSSDKLPAIIEFSPDTDFRQSGFWELAGFTVVGGVNLDGIYVEKKLDLKNGVSKEITGALHDEDLGFCDIDEVVGSPTEGELICTGIAEAVQAYLILEGCGLMTEIQSLAMKVTKGQVKFSKKGDKATADFIVEGEYLNDDLKSKKYKVMLKSPNMDFVLGADVGDIINPL